METIVALATPAGNSGVAVIRISGEKSKQILQLMIGEKLDFEPRKMYFKKVTAKSIVDDALVVYFAAPNSFTGEDVAEIQSHGGYFLAQKIIEQCLEYGAVMATRGEFSKRAFINGKMSMDQAEGIMDLISAESDMQAKMGSSLLQGKLKTYIEENQNKLTDLLAEMEAKLDYPEYDYSTEEIDGNLKKIEDITKTLKNLITDSKNGLTIKNGVKVAIVGAPNVGKSSLLNALTKSNKAIVTDIAGTTRDVVEAEYEFNGIIFRLFDTAGIHESADVVEQIGITRAKETLQTCDLVLLVSDKDNLCEVKTNKPSIKIFN
ncbi:MAG: tRNA uridine-5-carboxymethylaminomethyl(34) synthesis GTPase MnmE, partial [Clostridia bacterium]|nr:tRNA uridine-5-carboxymethylaminomethyl(34) synthesis GTPase MnmE [Clostridia bacterium]